MLGTNKRPVEFPGVVIFVETKAAVADRLANSQRTELRDGTTQATQLAADNRQRETHYIVLYTDWCDGAQACQMAFDRIW